MQLFEVQSHVLAYFDPGSGSLVLQSLVGGTAGLFVFGKYLWGFLKDRLRSSKTVSDPNSR